jgi:Protein of unknown function (DUF3553)
MTYKVGQRITCTPKPEWGIGIVSSETSDDGKFHVDFEYAGLKQLTTAAKLEVVPDETGCTTKHRPNINGALTVLWQRAKATLEMKQG